MHVDDAVEYLLLCCLEGQMGGFMDLAAICRFRG